MTILPGSARKLKKLIEGQFKVEQDPWAERMVLDALVIDHRNPYGRTPSSLRFRYLKDSWRNHMLGTGIEGFELLLANLAETKLETILTHLWVDTEGREFRIFTDLEISELVGVLRYPASVPKTTEDERQAKLLELISESFGSNANPWLSDSDVATASLKVHLGDELVRVTIHEITLKRARRNAKRGGSIEGFENLLEKLERSESPGILIHRIVAADGRQYSVFTNPDINELLGLLRFPMERQGEGSEFGGKGT